MARIVPRCLVSHSNPQATATFPLLSGRRMSLLYVCKVLSGLSDRRPKPFTSQLYFGFQIVSVSPDDRRQGVML